MHDIFNKIGKEGSLLCQLWGLLCRNRSNERKKKRFLPCSYDAAWDTLTMADFNVETETSDSWTLYEWF